MPEGRDRTVRPRRGDLEAASTPHAFRPSGEFVGASRAERCDLCGLAQRGEGTMHPASLGHGCADPDCDFLKPPPSDRASDRTSDRGAVSLHAIRDIAGFATACLLGALLVLGLLALGADRRCHNDPSLALCEPATTTQETTRP